MSNNGIWSKSSCEEVLVAGKKEIRFVDTKIPESSTGVTTTISGTLFPDGRIVGGVSETGNLIPHMLARTDGTGFNLTGPNKPLAEIARDALVGPAKACKRALGTPGVK